LPPLRAPLPESRACPPASDLRSPWPTAELARRSSRCLRSSVELASDHLDLVRQQRPHVCRRRRRGNTPCDCCRPRSPPSSCADDTRNTFGPLGPGWWVARESGGAGGSPNWWIDAAALAVDVCPGSCARVAAADVNTCLPSGGERRLVEVAELHAVAPGQDSMAWGDAAVFATGIGGLATGGARAMRWRRTVLTRMVFDVHAAADFDAHPELGALGLHLREATVRRWRFSILNRGCRSAATTDADRRARTPRPVAFRVTLRGGEPRGTGSERLANPCWGPVRTAGTTRFDPALAPGPLDDLDLEPA